jgi:phosphoribosylformylglycinamidine synthase
MYTAGLQKRYLIEVTTGMKFLVKITISLKEGMLDPEATAIRHALANLGFETEELRSAKVFFIRLDAESEGAARELATGMCERLLANPVIHSYEIEVLQ